MLHLSVLCWNNYVGKHFEQQTSWHFFSPLQMMEFFALVHLFYLY